MGRVHVWTAPSRLLSCCALGALALAAPASAADDDPIIVTARRIDEQSAAVPLAIDVVRAGDIGTGAVDSLKDLALKVPGLSFESIWGGARAYPVLRGQQQPGGAGDAVGMFVDGVYQVNRDATDVEPLDLERIEVVHGPQSALFGHSSFSGLIHYIAAQPTEELLLSGATDLATDRLRGVQGIVSGPLNGVFKARLAASYRTAGGTYRNAASSSQRLGSSDRFAIAASLATRDAGGPFSARLSARYGEVRSNQPAFLTLDYRDFNCGSRDVASGAWSYFCGKTPTIGQASLSPDIPDSRTRTGQVSLHLALDAGAVELRSDTSFYRADSDAIRDIDGSADGELYGVCIAGVNCSGIASLTIPVVRLQRVNIVERRSLSGREFAQELRIRSPGDSRFGWQIGGTVFWTRLQTTMAFGAGRGSLAANERFSSLVLSNPQRVGAPPAIIAAVVDDPNRVQIVRSDAVEERRTIALFATADYRLTERVRLRGEVRSSWERLVLDSRKANSTASFGTSLGPRRFQDITPRFSLDWRPAAGWLTFASYARGSRSGGINSIPDLQPAEQTYEPESNWTAEIGLKYSGPGLIRSAQMTAYDIDWRNTQIFGFSSTPGVNALIQRNTRGLHTQGIEIGAVLAPARWLQFDFAYSYTSPRFKPGSEDPGSTGVCGLALGITTSSFCTIRPSLINPDQLVPDISGNRAIRVPATNWTAGVSILPDIASLRGLRLRTSVSHRGNAYERAVNGIFYGARTLLDARLSYDFGPGSVELWGTNLGNARYTGVVLGHPPAFYLGIPRPIDLILGERRRIGLTVRFSH